jgi:acetylornithine deacetylase
VNDFEKTVIDALSADDLSRMAVEAARIPSARPYANEADLAELWAQELRTLGFAVEMMEVEPGRPNVVGRLVGTGGGRSVLYNGHSDTSPPVDGWTRDPFGGEVDQGRIYGQGMSNMKASNVAMLAAARALVDSGVERSGDVVVALVAGECDGGLGTKHLVQNVDLDADVFINGEPSDLRVITLHAGVCRLLITVTGISHHFGTSGHGVNAIEQMMPVLQEIGPSLAPIDWLPVPTGKPEYAGYPLLNIGVVHGGLTKELHEWGPYNTPDYCTATIDVRHPPGIDAAAIARLIEEHLRAAPATATVGATVEPLLRYCLTPYEAAPEDEMVGVLADAVADVTGATPEIGAIAPIKFMGSDAGCLQGAGIPGAVCGVGTFTSSVPDEYVELEKLVDLARVYALATLRVISSPRG